MNKLWAAATLLVAGITGADERPNIVLIMGDDIGFSDIGCYGSQIETPNLDSMARDGLRFQQFYNMAKCSPTRSALLTGLYGGYEHVLPIGKMLSWKGYHTGMFGKNHLAETFKRKEHFAADYFDRSLSFWGCTKFFFEEGEESPFFLNGKNIAIADMQISRKPFYKTDVFTDYALRFLDEAIEQGKPFFLYLPYHTAHFPIQARREDIARYRGRFMEGWDVLRQRRFKKMKLEGVVPTDCKLSPPESLAHRSKGGWNEKADDPERRAKVWQYRPWASLSAKEKDEMDLEMAVYAGMIDRMDQNIGRVLAKLDELGCAENTLVIYLSDNGACAHDYNANFDYLPGHPKSYRSMSAPWSNLSNTPFRQYKWFGFGGGCNTHCIVRWPKEIAPGQIVSEPGHVVDLYPTFLDAAGLIYPGTFRKKPIVPLQGSSLLPVFKGGKRTDSSVFISGMPSFRMYRAGDWKITRINSGDWMLFNLAEDWTELNDLAAQQPERLQQLVNDFDAIEQKTKLYNVWEARRAKVK